MHPSVCEPKSRDMAQVITGRPFIAEARIQFQETYVCSVVNTESMGQVPLAVFHFSPTNLIAPTLPAHIPLISDDPIIKAVESIHSVVCLTRGHTFLQSEFFTDCDLLLPLSIYSILSFPLRLSIFYL